MDVDEVLRRLGGVGARSVLVERCGRAAVDAALSSGRIEVAARGRYALATAEADRRTAHALSGVLSHESAALAHGWPVLLPPEQPHVTVPLRRGRVPSGVAVVHRSDLLPDDVKGGVTSPARTLVDCMRNLPFRQALAVADSALRSGRSQEWLAAFARDLRGRGAGQARLVAASADELADNPFESGLRAVALGVPGLTMRPQVPVHDTSGRFLGRPDLVDERLRIIAEADSFQWHGSRVGLVRDARRYNGFAVAGWLVLRFTWEDVVLEPERVAGVLAAAVQRQ